MIETQKKLDEIEKCIKEGHFSRAKTLVDRLKVNDVSRSDALRASNLARRCGKVKKSLKILNPIVRNPQVSPKASDKEKADYAFSLHRIGASFEAENLLGQVEPGKASSALFFRSLIAFSRWEYSRALPWLNQYIKSDEITDYQRLIGRSNRVSIYLFQKEYEKADREVEQLLREAETRNLKLLKNLSVEQKAEILVGQGQYREAEKIILRLEKEAADSASLLQMWIWKWKMIIKAFQASEASGLAILNKASIEAYEKGAWEIVRDFDFFKVKIHSDKKALRKLYFGTPFPHYIERLKKLGNLPKNDEYLFSLTTDTENVGTVLDMRSQCVESGSGLMNIQLTEMQWRLLKCLLIDLYRPLKWGELFNSLFPDEYFDPFTSINRLHQIIFRLNQSLKKQSVDLRIISNDSGCQFMSGADLGFRIHEEMEDDLYLDPQILRLREITPPGQELTISDICQHLGGNIRTQRRWVRKMLEEGKMLKLGENRSTRYRLVG